LVALTSKQDIRAALAAFDGKLTVFGAVGATNTVRASVGRAGGSFGAARTLHVANGSLLGATLARSGPVALLRRCFTRECQKADIVLVRQTSAGWSQPRAITKPVDANRGAVLAGGLVALPDGEIAVAYERDNVLYLRRVTPAGKLSAAQRLGVAIQAHIVLAPMGGHRLLVAWAWQAINEDYAHSPFHVRLACSNTAGHFSGHSQALATIPLTGAERYVQGPGIVLAGRTLAWTDYAGGRYDVRAGDINDACAITAQTLAIPGSDVVLDDLAIGPAGSATIALGVGRRANEPTINPTDQTQLGVFAATRAASGAPFDAPQRVSPPSATILTPASVAIDRSTGRSAIVYADNATPELALTPR
jgi:hypothetical protein